MIVFDSTCALLTIFPAAPVPTDPSTGLPVTDAAVRVEHVLKMAADRRETVALPAPALSEILVRAGSDMTALIDKLQRSSLFEIVSFDHRAAVEVALIARDALASGDKKDGSADTWAKIKYDRQIVAISRVIGASAIYSDDHGIRKVATRIGLPVVRLSECMLPISAAQSVLNFGGDKTHGTQQASGTPDAD